MDEVSRSADDAWNDKEHHGSRCKWSAPWHCAQKAYYAGKYAVIKIAVAVARVAVDIAVALMGRSHPLGIVLSAMLFGLLYQGGTELSFAKPLISRDMIVVIQGLVILFMGALEYAFRPALARIFVRVED